jgi:hypothetical protein
MKRTKRLTRKQRKALNASAAEGHRHIHCIACGRHIDPQAFTQSPITARYIKCLHGTTFAVCVGCENAGRKLLEEHDRTGQPVNAASAWH